jgi:hypothetical protein
VNEKLFVVRAGLVFPSDGETTEQSRSNVIWVTFEFGREF